MILNNLIFCKEELNYLGITFTKLSLTLYKKFNFVLNYNFINYHFKIY